MSLIDSPRFQPGDRKYWESLAQEDAAWARTASFVGRCTRALDDLMAFARLGPCYAGTSWGKDSVVLAHLVWCAQEELGVGVPLVYVIVMPIQNPDCPSVRAAFLERWPLEYHEIVTWCTRNPDAPAHDYVDGWYSAAGLTSGEGFREAARRFGGRYISGIRGAESAGRAKRMRAYGISTERTCAPLGHWSDRDIFAYLQVHDLPVHPAYAMSMGGALNRGRLRVASIGGRRGIGMGRTEWERAYYPRIPEEILAAERRP